MLHQISKESRKKAKGRRVLPEELGHFSPTADHRIYEPDGDFDFEIPPRIFMKPIVDKTLVACASEDKRAFMPDARSDEPRAKYVIHPSQAGGCFRKAFFSFVEAPKDPKAPNARLQRIFDVGHEGHRRIQGYLFEAWKRGIGEVTCVWENVEIEIPEMRVKGELDCIFEVLNRHRILVDVKTSARNTFEALKGPKIDWVWQVHLYMYAVGIMAAIIYVECKDNQEAKEFWVPFDEKIWGEIELACSKLREFVRQSKYPQDMDRSQCWFCDYQQVCECKVGVDWEKVEEAMEK